MKRFACAAPLLLFPILLLPTGCAPRAAAPVAVPAAVAATATAAARPTPLPMLEPPDLPPEPAGLRIGWEAEELAVKGENARALLLYRASWEAGHHDLRNAYNAACVAVRAGERAEALTWLTRAIEGGWCDGAHAAKDPDLAPLRAGAEAATLDALLRRAESNRGSAECNDSELNAIQIADQEDRSEGPNPTGAQKNFESVRERDAARRARVAGLVREGRVHTKADWFAAAIVYQHGASLDDFERARTYAYESAKLGNRDGFWLTAAAWDRWLLNAGYPQRFGTQYTCKPKCVLKPYDPSVTDDERTRWNCPTLAEAEARTFE